MIYQGGPCPPEVCGGNSGEVLRNGVHHANLFGKLDENKISLEIAPPNVDATPRRAQIWDANGRPFDLYVEKGTLFGRDPSTDDILEHEELVGSEIHLLQSGVPLYNIRIDDVRVIEMPVGSPEPVEVYTMVWVDRAAQQEGEPCEVPVHPFDDVKDAKQLLGMRSNETLVFEGDNIDPVTKTMNQNADWDPDWINFGCAGRTIAKLRLLRKTQATGSGKWESRQAALKMLSADYCGSGHSFTVTGTHIGWRDAEDLVDYVQTPTVIEARWSHLGAMCLSTPRMVHAITYQRDYIDNECLLALCSEGLLMTPDIYELDGQQIVSALYD